MGPPLDPVPDGRRRRTRPTGAASSSTRPEWAPSPAAPSPAVASKTQLKRGPARGARRIAGSQGGGQTMTSLKTVLLGSAAGLLAAGAAQAADLPVKKAAAAVQYVEVCPVYGSGFYKLPGTDICIRHFGNVKFNFAFQNEREAWDPDGPGAFDSDRSETAVPTPSAGSGRFVRAGISAARPNTAPCAPSCRCASTSATASSRTTIRLRPARCAPTT